MDGCLVLGGINFQTMLNAYHGGWKLRAGPLSFIKKQHFTYIYLQNIIILTTLFYNQFFIDWERGREEYEILFLFLN